MKRFAVTKTINAPKSTIWSLLTDAAGYPEWNTSVIKIDGMIALNEKISVLAKISPDRAFDVSVVEFVPEEKMVWKGGMPMGMLTGIRTYDLKDDGDGVTEFSMVEEFTGLMVGMIPDLSEPFEEFAECLKKKAESS